MKRLKAGEYRHFMSGQTIIVVEETIQLQKVISDGIVYWRNIRELRLDIKSGVLKQAPTDQAGASKER